MHDVREIPVITRSFQGGAGVNGRAFDIKQFNEKVAGPIVQLLKSLFVSSIIVVVNGEYGNKLAEGIDADGTTPTMRALRESFPVETREGKIIPLLAREWGRNPGSGLALNQGLRFVVDHRAVEQDGWVMMWSPEIEMNDNLISDATDLIGENELRQYSLVGFLRQHWYEKAQWHMPQNTACLWSIDDLLSVGGFAPVCNGSGEFIEVDGLGQVEIAGMEDFHAALRFFAANEKTFHWGVVGMEFPLRWDTNFKKGSEREQNHLKKVARQGVVMEAWAKKIFPDLSPSDILEQFFARGVIR